MRMTTARRLVSLYAWRYREMGLFQKAITRAEFDSVFYSLMAYCRYVGRKVHYTSTPGAKGKSSMCSWNQPHRLPKPADILTEFIALANSFYQTSRWPPTDELRRWLDTAHIDDAGFLRWTQPTEDTTNEHSG